MTPGREWAEHAYRVLRASGHRTGGARQAVIDILAESGGGLTALEVTAQLRTGPRRASTASVYRALTALADLGLAHRVGVGQGVSRFELVLPTGEHHHHVVCSRCGRTELFRDAALEQALRTTEARMPFLVESHDVILHGVCPDCSPN